MAGMFRCGAAVVLLLVAVAQAADLSKWAVMVAWDWVGCAVCRVGG